MDDPSLRIGIVGGGLTGLALAERLSQSGPGGRSPSVIVLEREGQIGGLATWQDFGPFVWDRFYHVILPSDRHLIPWLGKLGLADRLRWRRTLTGVHVDGASHSISSALEFLRFRPLSLWSKARLAWTILRASRINDGRRLEEITVEDFLLRLSGRRTYEKFWKPLLLAKLGESYRRVSAVFIWTYIKRLFSARDASASRESLGYVSGGYRTVFGRLAERIAAAGGEIRTGVAVRRIAADPAGGLRIETDRGADRFDRVIFTGPVDALERAAGPELVSLERPGGATVEYLGVVCMALLTRRALMPYYVLNLADGRIPFTGVIGMSNLVALEETAGIHLTYLPRYVHSKDPLLDRPDAEIRPLFEAGLELLFPGLAREDIVDARIHRAAKVQPLQVLGYSRLVPRVETRHPGFFVLNTSQFAQSTLNNDEVIRNVEEFLRQHGNSFAGGGSSLAGGGEAEAVPAPAANSRGGGELES